MSCVTVDRYYISQCLAPFSLLFVGETPSHFAAFCSIRLTWNTTRRDARSTTNNGDVAVVIAIAIAIATLAHTYNTYCTVEHVVDLISMIQQQYGEERRTSCQLVQQKLERELDTLGVSHVSSCQ